MAYAIKSVIAAGTFSILRLNPSDTSISLFNILDSINTPYFTEEEMRELFNEFEKDYWITVEEAIVEDRWAKSNGCVTSLVLIYHHLYLGKVTREWSVFVDA